MKRIEMLEDKPFIMDTPLFSITFMPKPKEINNLSELPTFSVPLVNVDTAQRGVAYVKVNNVDDDIDCDMPVMLSIIGKHLCDNISNLFGDGVIYSPRHVNNPRVYASLSHDKTPPESEEELRQLGVQIYQNVVNAVDTKSNNSGEVVTADGSKYKFLFDLGHGIRVSISEKDTEDETALLLSSPATLHGMAYVDTTPATVRVQRDRGPLFGDVVNTTMLSKAIEQQFDKVFGRLTCTVSGGLTIGAFNRQGTDEELKEQRGKGSSLHGLVFADSLSFPLPNPRNRLY